MEKVNEWGVKKFAFGISSKSSHILSFEQYQFTDHSFSLLYFFCFSLSLSLADSFPNIFPLLVLQIFCGKKLQKREGFLVFYSLSINHFFSIGNPNLVLFSVLWSELGSASETVKTCNPPWLKAPSSWNTHSVLSPSLPLSPSLMWLISSYIWVLLIENGSLAISLIYEHSIEILLFLYWIKLQPLSFLIWAISSFPLLFSFLFIFMSCMICVADFLRFNLEMNCQPQYMNITFNLNWSRPFHFDFLCVCLL